MIFAQSGNISTIAGNGQYGLSAWNGFATSMSLSNPRGVSVDAIGNVFFSDSLNFRMMKLTPTGALTTLAGQGYSGFAGDGGPAARATLISPGGTALDSLGNLYFTEGRGDRIRKIDTTGIISTVAGTGVGGFSGDGGYAINAQLSNPQSLAIDAVGNLYIVDVGNNRIRKMDTAGIISTVAGNGTVGWYGDGGLAIDAQLSSPQSVTLDPAGNIFIADSANHKIRKVDTGGIISTVAGDGNIGFSGDGGPALSARLASPRSVWADEAGNLFIGDYNNDRIRKIDSAGLITTIAGTGQLGYGGDGGQAILALLYYPLDITVDADGNLYFADIGNNRIRKILGPSAVTTYFSQVAVGDGYTTYLTITNTGSAGCSANLDFKDSSGQPLIVNADVKDPSSATQYLTDSSFPIVVPSGGISFITVTGVDPNLLQAGWARLVSAKGSLTAIATYEHKIGGFVKTIVGVLQSQRVLYATIPVDNDTTQAKQLAFAVANPTGQTLTVKLALVAPDGTVVNDSHTITLDPKKQVAIYLDQVTGYSNFKGTLVLRGQNRATFIVLALLDKEGVFTTLPVVAEKAPGVP